MQKSKLGLILSLFILQVFSLATIWSTYQSLFLTQLSFFLVGVFIIYIVSKTDHSIFFTFSTFLYFFSIFLLIITFFLGKNVRGSVRWIDFGIFSLQTSEIIKPMLAIFYSNYLAQNKLKKFADYLKFLCYAAVPSILVAKQPDLGSALTIAFLPFFLLSVSGYLKQTMILVISFLIIAVPMESLLLKPYQKTRIETFINPYKDPKGAGYNVIQAMIAIGSGRVFGKGVKLGTQSHLNFLPERHTDFVFASFVEEFGFIGAVTTIVCFFYILRSALYVAGRQKNKSSELLILSGFATILFQFVVNLGMNLGIMPVTGITLPLFSYGGSSLLSFSIFLGFLVRQLDLLPPIEI